MTSVDPAPSPFPDRSDRLAELLSPARELALDLTPEVRHLGPPVVPPRPNLNFGEFGRSNTTSRTLDAESLDQTFSVIDRVLEPVHDIAVAAFQRMIDQVAGHACPLREDNSKLVNAIMLRVDRFGLGLYMEGIGEMHRVQVSAEDVSPARRRRGNEAVNAAGAFRISLVTEPGEPAIGRSRPESVPAFIRRDALPGLIVARSREEARQILLARKLSALGSAGEPSTIASQRDEGPRDQPPR